MAKKELVITICFKITEESLKSLGINLSKDEEDFYDAKHEKMKQKKKLK